MKAIGGINAFLAPFVKALTPYFIFHFLYLLADILKRKNEETFQLGFISFLCFCKWIMNKKVTKNHKITREMESLIEDIDLHLQDFSRNFDGFEIKDTCEGLEITTGKINMK